MQPLVALLGFSLLFSCAWSCPSDEGLGHTWVQGFFCLAGRTAFLSCLRSPPCGVGTPTPDALAWTRRAAWISPQNGKRDIPCAPIDHYSAGSVAGRATYPAAHFELDRAITPRWTGRCGDGRAGAGGWRQLDCDHRMVPDVLGSTTVPTWPLAGTAVCRGLAEVARGDGPAHGDLRPGKPSACL
jgi:hypothetical protein